LDGAFELSPESKPTVEMFGEPATAAGIHGTPDASSRPTDALDGGSERANARETLSICNSTGGLQAKGTVRERVDGGWLRGSYLFLRLQASGSGLQGGSELVSLLSSVGSNRDRVHLFRSSSLEPDLEPGA